MENNGTRLFPWWFIFVGIFIKSRIVGNRSIELICVEIIFPDGRLGPKRMSVDLKPSSKQSDGLTKWTFNHHIFT